MNIIVRLSFRLLFLSQFSIASDIYQSIRVFNPSNERLELISKVGIPLEHISGKKGIYIDLTAREEQTIELMSLGLDPEILIPDLTSYYLERNQPASQREFPLGSMMGNYTWGELNDRFDELQEAYPGIISPRLIIGESVEGRDIWAFKVSDNPNEDENEPEVLYTSLTHSREPLGMMNLFYFVQSLAEEYGNDQELTYLVNERELWFIPVVNPDGYVFNESIQPDGGGMHRKNRQDTNCGDYTERGVDLNRNYGYGWGSNDTGSSPNPCSATYRGTSAFSEPETQAVRNFMDDREFMNVLHYHTFSNVYIHAFGDASLPDEPDLSTHREIGEEMSRFNGYQSGTGYETIGYTVNGDAVDWSYGDQEIVAFTPEVGSQSQGFWPSESDVLPLCEEQLHANKTFALVAGPDLIMYEYELTADVLNPGDQIGIEILIQNRGLTDLSEEFQIELSPFNNMTIISDSSFTFNNLNARNTVQFFTEFSIDDGIQNGSDISLIFSIISESSFSRMDTISFMIGDLETIFFDGFENGINNWYVTGDWGLTGDALDGNYALSDSPNGDYDEAQESVAEFETDLDLNYFPLAIVEYTAKWEIESNWDFVQFQADIEGEGWVSLEGIFTELGSGQSAQPEGEPGYDGTQEDWVTESIDLNQLGNTRIFGFRFMQTSDNYVEGDGFTIDNFRILGISSYKFGDFNADNSVDILDVFGVADLILNNMNATAYQLTFCDLNNDNQIDIVDILLLVNKILGIQ